jgi:hypothetical protein
LADDVRLVLHNHVQAHGGAHDILLLIIFHATMFCLNMFLTHGLVVIHFYH